MNLYDSIVYEAIAGSGGGGGGGSSYTLIASDEFDFSTTSTASVAVKTINTGIQFRSADKLTAVRVYDKGSARNGYFVEFWGIIFDYEALNSSPSSMSFGNRLCIYKGASGSFTVSTSEQGIYPFSLKRTAGTDRIEIRAKASSSMAIDGTYVCEIYFLDFPNGIGPVNR